MSTVLPVIFAHQGGWDEMLLVAAPILVFVLLLRLANRRADRQVGARAAEPDDVGPADTSGHSTG